MNGISIETEFFVLEGRKFNQHRLKVTLRDTSLLYPSPFRFEMPNDVDQISSRVRTAVLKAFPDSPAAESIREEQGLNLSIVKPLSPGQALVEIHTGMRKILDSPASSLWHRLIHGMPSFLNVWLSRSTHETLLGIKEPMPLADIAKALHHCWYSVFNNAAKMKRLESFDRQEAEICGLDIQDIHELKIRELDEIHEIATLSLLSLDYLREKDWRDLTSLLCLES